MAAVAKQPVSVAIEGGTSYFKHYGGGILSSSACGTDINHAVLLIGYG